MVIFTLRATYPQIDLWRHCRRPDLDGLPDRVKGLIEEVGGRARALRRHALRDGASC